MANRLAQETSPYLLQHAHNPVDWYPWDEEALTRARDEQKPIFLSIGYAACHWCHVMERESFEDKATAAQMNRDFVAIKVDREERPDLDAIYMDAVQSMTGSGGWPLNVFLTPDGKPFYGGTYFPDQPRHGLPSFRQVLEGVATAWRDRRAGDRAGRHRPGQGHRRGAAPATFSGRPAAVDARHRAGWIGALIRRAQRWLGPAPKFPQAMAIEFLLAQHIRTADQRPLAMARRSLDAMAAGGIYDQLGGGFARYSTDEHWLVPHFEKMLYDNALLARAYAHAWQLTRDARYRQVVEQTLGFMRREMTTADGAFISSLDADTDGEEGATYVWSKREVDDALGGEAAEFEAAYGVTAQGNWEGHNILSRVDPGADYDRLAPAATRLLAIRQGRPQPARDDKVLTAWNGLAIAAFADAARAMGDAGWADVAAAAADLLLGHVRTPDGTLRRSFKDGRARQSGVLEDYANLADGLLALYQATFDERWFVAARDLAEQILARFGDPAGGYFDTANDHETLIARPKGLQDNAMPSGGAMATQVMLRLAALTGDGRYRDAAESALRGVTAVAHRYPTGFAHWLGAFQLALGPLLEVAIVGDSPSLLATVNGKFRPLSVLAAKGTDVQTNVPLLLDRPLRDGRPTAYVCLGFACRQPVTESADLEAQLSSPTP